MLNDEQKAKLKEVGDALLKESGLDIDLVSVVESRGEEATKRLEAAHVAHKEAKDGKKQDDGDAGAQPPKGAPADEQVEAIAQRVAGLLDLEGLSTVLTGFQDSLKGITSRLDEVEKGDLERVNEQEKWRPGYMWRASQEAGTILADSGEDKDLKESQPVVPKAIQGITNWRYGQPPAAGGSA